MSLCDSCYKPGHCCKGFTLNIDSPPWETKLHMLVVMARHELPFLPLERAFEGEIGAHLESRGLGQLRTRWRFECPVLGADGRCTDYDNRPDLCRAFTAGLDELCIHYLGAESGPH